MGDNPYRGLIKEHEEREKALVTRSSLLDKTLDDRIAEATKWAKEQKDLKVKEDVDLDFER